MSVPVTEIVRRSGVVLALPVNVDRSVVYHLCAGLASHADAFAAGEGDVIAAYDFASERGETVLAVSHIGRRAVEARPDIAIVLGNPVVDALRIDSFTTPDAPEATLRAEVFLLRVARDIARIYAGLVCDDVGAIYSPLDLDARVAAGLPRETSFAFDAAVGASIEVLRDGRARANIAFPELTGATEPSECAPDIALATASVFVVMSPHVPIITATRIAFARYKVRSLPVVVFAPLLLAGDALVLRAAGIFVARSAGELGEALALNAPTGMALQQIVPRNPYGRDEIALYASSNLGIDEVSVRVERRTVEIAQLAGRGFADQPVVAIEDAVVDGRGVPVRLARYAFPGTVLDVYHLSLVGAHPLLAALVAARAEVQDVVDRDLANVVVCESLVENESTSQAADALAVSLLAQLSIGAWAVAQDDSGALFDPQHLIELSAARRGRGGSWNERVATAGLFAES